MARCGKPLDVVTMRRVQELRRTLSVRAVARLLGLHRATVAKYAPIRARAA